MLTLLLACGIAGTASAQTGPLLQLQGAPYSGGDLTMHLSGDVGKQAFVLYGLNPLDPPLITSKGPLFVGTLANIVPLGSIPSGGRIDVPFTVPPLHPSLAGIPLVMQGYVPGALSNPATLPLDQPYLLPENAIVVDHPVPSHKAKFGECVAAGDFNNDGTADLAVSARFESVNGAAEAGRVYILWGPEYASYTALEPSVPVYRLHFGQGLAVADFDGDDIDDLAVGEGTGGDPPTPDAHGHAYIFRGGAAFPTSPWATVTSSGTGLEGYPFGGQMRAGDINGDSVPDLVIGTMVATVQGVAMAGRLEVFHGPQFAKAQLVENPEPKPNDFFGSAVSLGDVSGNGVLDIIEASGRASTSGLSQVGRLHVYDGPTLTLLQTIENPQPAAGDRFGEGLHVADLDGDGLVEVIAADVKKTFYVVWDAPGGLSIASWSKPPSPNPTPASTSFGYFFAATDASGDGTVDIVIADPFEGDSVGCGLLSAGGALYVALAPFYSTYLRLANPFSACGDEFSWNLIAADLEGDGIDELVAGNDTADVGGVFNAGSVVIVRR
jgi:hypothetical protein